MRITRISGVVLALAIGIGGFLTVGTKPAAWGQTPDTPSLITGKLPKKAECVVCTARGTMTGELKVAAGVTYKGKAYYFCNKAEVAEFVKDPESFLPKPLPRPAPTLTLPGPDGTPISPERFQGKVLLVDFWATWCVPCVDAMPTLQKMNDKYAAKGFSVVGVSVDEEGAKKVSPFLAKRKQPLTYPILLDTGGEKGVWKTWGVVAVPAAFLVKDGQIIRQWTGKIDLKEVDKAVSEAVQGR